MTIEAAANRVIIALFFELFNFNNKFFEHSLLHIDSKSLILKL